MAKLSIYDGTDWVELLTSSDISSWAREPNKPSYNLDEIPDGSVRKLSDYYPVSNPNGYTSVTEATVTNWGFTKNQGTVTSVAIGVGTGLAIDNASAITTSGTRTISIDSSFKLPTTTEWNSKANSADLGNAAAKNYTTSVASGSNDLVTSGAVFTAISELPTPMQFKGTLGIGGTISVLPAASSSNNGYTYKVISDIASLNAKVGDVFVSNGSEWVLIPAGDDVEDTWREIYVDGTLFKGSGISSGRVNFVPGRNVTMRADGNDITISSSSNADTLDGHDSSYFYPASNPNGYIAGVTQQDVTTALNLGTVNNSTSWGTLTAANGYTVRWGSDQPSGGGLVFAEKNGQTSMQVDGEIYVNEGSVRLAHVGESQPASDVYPWAKEATKPSYNFSEIQPGTAVVDYNGGVVFRNETSSWYSGIYYSTPNEEAVVFANKSQGNQDNAYQQQWLFAYTDMQNRTAWTDLGSSVAMQIKGHRVAINKMMGVSQQIPYNLDVNGSANATTVTVATKMTMQYNSNEDCIDFVFAQ